MKRNRNGKNHRPKVQLRAKRTITQYCHICTRTRKYVRLAENIYQCPTCKTTSQFLVAGYGGGRHG